MKRFFATLAILATAAMPLASHAAGTIVVKTGDLIKGSGSAVYYLYDGQRLVFPTDKTYFSWYKDFSGVKTISDAQLQTYPLKANVTYKPGTRLVKITTDPKVYAIAAGGKLRAITSEAVAKLIFGANWAQQIDDIPDAFFVNYQIGDLIDTNDSYNAATESSKAASIWQDKGYATPVDGATQY